jgi:hypothetical protein
MIQRQLDTRLPHGNKEINMDVRRRGVKGGGMQVEASPRSTIDAFSTKTQNESAKQVSFASEDMLEQEIPPTGSRMELTEEDVATLWYTKDEYRLSKKSQLFIVKMMERGLSSLEDDDELCPRGLEERTRKGARSKQQNIDASRDAVMWEQEHQWEGGRHNSWALSRVYSESAAQCTMAAFLIGKRDAQYVYVHGKGTSKSDR